jgi:hypothetical protein
MKGGCMKKGFPLKALDIVVILLALGLMGFSAFVVYVQLRNTTQVVINASSREWIFPLDADDQVEVPGPLGKTMVRIRNHQAWVESSPCTNQVCVAAGHIREGGEWVACLPNNVFLMIERNEVRKNAPDTTTW